MKKSVTIIILLLIVIVFGGSMYYLYQKNAENPIVYETEKLSKQNIEVEMSSIRTVKVDQSFVDRIFNCGILRVYTAGDKPDLQQGGLPDPERLRTALRNARDTN